MFHRLIVRTDKPIRRDRKDPRIDQLRGAVIDAVKRSGLVGEEAMRWINFRPPPPYYHTPPKILYAQPAPGRRFFEIYAFGDDGLRMLGDMAESLSRARRLSVGGEIVEVARYEIQKELPWMPEKDGREYRYYTGTPLILYDKDREHREWTAITSKFIRLDPDRYDREMKRSVANLLRANLRYQLRTRVGEGDYPFVDRIGIEIDDFRFFKARYHKDRPETPMLHMRFRSNWRLPKFLGHHIGKGYGAIMLDKRIDDAKS